MQKYLRKFSKKKNNNNNISQSLATESPLEKERLLFRAQLSATQNTKNCFTLCACILPHIVDFSAHLSRLYTPRRLLDNLFLAWVTKGGTDLHSKRQCISYRPLVSPVKQRRQVLYIGKLLGQLPPFFENKKFLSH